MSDLARDVSQDPVSAFDAIEERHEHLRARIRSAARNNPRFPDFIAQLKNDDVVFACRLTRKGRVSSISYSYQSDLQIKASALGDEFTWTGLQRKLGLEYVQIRDFELLESLKEASPPSVKKQTGGKSTVEYEAALVSRLERVEALEQQLLERLESLQDEPSIEIDQAPLSEVVQQAKDELQRVDEAVLRLEQLAANLEQYREDAATRSDPVHSLPASDDLAHLEQDVRHQLTQIKGISQQAISDSNRAMQRVEFAANKMRQESFWLACVTALIAAFASALLTGLWINQETQKSLENNKQTFFEQLDQRDADDPLRAYFQKIMDNMP